MRSLYFFALVIACCSCGDDRLRSARGDAAGRKRVPETLGARLARLAPSPDRGVSLRDVVASAMLVGRRVRVTGRCAMQLSVPERPARSGAMWQLEGDGVTVLVVGALPSRCADGRKPLLTVTAVVAEDTLADIGDLPGAPRRYLVVDDAR